MAGGGMVAPPVNKGYPGKFTCRVFILDLASKEKVKMAGGGMVAPPVNKGYPGKFTCRVFITCIVAATGGLIFGYDIGILGGVTSMPPFLEKFFSYVFRKEVLNIGGNKSVL